MSKLMVVKIAIAVFLMATPLLAQPPQGRGGPPRGGPRFGGESRKLLDQFDATKDGWLNQEERSSARKFIKENPSQGGFGRGGPGGRRGGPGGRAGRPGGRPPGGRGGSPDGPGRGDRGPGGFGGGPGGGFDPTSIFDMQDKNDDGKLTQDEVKDSPMADQFSDIDKDGDKAITREEFQNGMQAMFRGGPGRGGPGRGGPGRGGPGGRRGFGGNRPPAKPGEKIAISDVDPVDAELYDPSVLRTIFIQFENDDWESELEDFHGTDVEVPATLTVDGKEYPLCGIHFRGMSSYMMIPAGHKRSFNVAMDLAHEDQRLYGFKTLNLLNGNGDDSMMSTVLYSHLTGKHMPAPKSNMVRVVVNGENWGVYTNVQQFNKDFLREHYPSAKGTRWKVAGSPAGGGGLDYRGEDLADYGHPYEMKDGNDEALEQLVELCRVMDEVPAAELENALKDILDVDELLWFLAYDNALCNSDGYWTRASDYSIFLDKKNTFHIIPHDMNEAFREAGGGGFRFGPPQAEAESGDSSKGLDPLIGMNDARKPLRSKILAVPAFREQYLANIRTIAEELKWENLGPVVAQFRDLISMEMKRDTRKLGTYENFLMMTSDVIPKVKSDAEAGQGRRGPGGHSAMNIRKFAEERSKFLFEATAKEASGNN